VANQFKNLPWIVDTPGASILITGDIKIDHIDYVGYSDPNHEVEIQDGSGHIIALIHGAADLSPVTNYMNSFWAAGMKVPSNRTSGGVNMQSGFIIIYIA